MNIEDYLSHILQSAVSVVIEKVTYTLRLDYKCRYYRNSLLFRLVNFRQKNIRVK